jgi:tRNA pseudouridine13 synthase
MPKGMYKLKSSPEDFIVEEQIKLHIDDSGSYAYFWLRKRGYPTVRALQKIANFLGCKLRDIGFAGNKDKEAVTKQAISLKDPGRRVGEKRFERFNSPEISLEYIGRGKAQICLGELEGNRFDIVLRECDKAPTAVKQFINYFDDQRFSETNKEVGKAIMKGDLKRACEMINAKEVAEHLSENPNDYVGAMKKLPLKIRVMHIHAYQSWIWNETVKEYITLKHKETVKSQYSQGDLVFPVPEIENETIPIVGFGAEKGDKDVDAIINKIMKNEMISERDFVIKSMPEISAEGGKREIVAEVRKLSIEKIDDRTYRLKFFLPKGCYATMAVKRMMA